MFFSLINQYLMILISILMVAGGYYLIAFTRFRVPGFALWLAYGIAVAGAVRAEGVEENTAGFVSAFLAVAFAQGIGMWQQRKRASAGKSEDGLAKPMRLIAMGTVLLAVGVLGLSY